MTPRISPLSLDEVNDQVRALYGEQSDHLGRVSPMLKIIARRPEFIEFYQSAFRARNAIAWQDLTQRGLPFLMAVKSAANLHSPYAVHWLREDNEATERITPAQFDAALRPYEGSPHFNDVEHLVLEFADAIAATLIEEHLWVRLHNTFSESELVDLVMIASIEAMFATFTKAVGLTSLDVAEISKTLD